MSGVVVCDQQKMSSLTVNGPVTLNGGRFGPVLIRGSLRSNQVTFQKSVQVRGPASFDRDHVYSGVKITGNIQCLASQFDGAVNVMSSSSRFNACKMNSIVMSGDDTLRTPALYLRDHSMVSGDISFKNKPGIVYLSANSHIYGRVNNGTIKMIS